MIKIVADTLSTIPVEKANELGIAYLPQIIIFGEESYRDDTEITTRVFLERLKNTKVLPKTAAPPPMLYHPIYQKAVENGDTLIVICPSTDLSGTYRSADVAAKDFPDLNVKIIDTRTISTGLGVLVLKSLEWVKQGLDADTIVANIQEMAPREKTYFVVDTLEFLHRGGRIGGAQALIGEILQVKPILTLKNGRVETFEKQRTHNRAIARLKEIVLGDCSHGVESHLCIQQGGAEDEAKALADYFKKTLNLPEVPIYEVPPAVLVHAGPGVVVATYFTEK